MSMTGKAFDWRGFWADLLQGAGRGLLALDGSDEAMAAMAGLDHFETAQRRRHEQQQTDAGNDVFGPLSEARADLARERTRADDDGVDRDAQTYQPDEDSTGDPRWYDQIVASATYGLAPSVRPQPFSANPHDYAALPPQMRFLSSVPTRALRRR